MDACRGKALALLAVVFALGSGSGVVGYWAFERQSGVEHVAPAVEPGQQVFGAVKELSDQLDLSDDQIGRVQGILDHYIMQEADLLLQLEQLRREGRGEILEILSAQQKSKFESMLHRVAAD